jgi:hypothetical protein
MCCARSSQDRFAESTAKIKSSWLLGNRTKPSSLSVVEEEKQNSASSETMTALPIRALIALPISQARRIPNVAMKTDAGAGLLQVLGNPSEWKCAATVALVFFVASLAAAPALTRDQHKLASEINAKTLKAAAAIKNSRVKH